MEDNKMFEVRSIEIRAVEDSRKITGTAIVFNSLSQDLGGFVEEIAPEAVNTEFLNAQDIVMLYNHKDGNIPLARSKKGTGSLRYNIDAVGVSFEFEAKDTALGNEVLAAVRAGDLDACSFAFRVAEGGEKWENIGGGLYKRTITKFELIRDFSIVLNPAYVETQVSNRSLEAFKAEEQRKLAEAQEEETRAAQLQLQNYYQQLKVELQSIGVGFN